MTGTDGLEDGRAPGLGRPRDDDAEQRVIDAALQVYAEDGWSGFNIAAVARRAQVGKSLIYLRWPDKNALLNDAVTRRGENPTEPDEGSLHGDVSELALRFHRHLQTSLGWVTLRIAVDATRSPELLNDFLRAAVAANRRAVQAMLTRAVDRDELSPGADSEVTVQRTLELIYGVVLAQSIQLPHADATVDGELLTDLVQAAVGPIVAGIRAAATATASMR